MSKRHQATRRRTYGRRQHEVHERHDRRPGHDRFDVDLGHHLEAFEIDPLAFLDPRTARVRFGFSD